MKSIEIISIPVTNQDAAKEFYIKLGFEVLVDAPFTGGQRWIQLGFPGSEVSITLVTWFPEMPSGSVRGFVIKTDNLEKDKGELTAKGIEVGEIDKTPWGRFMAVQDPDGNTVSLHQD